MSTTVELDAARPRAAGLVHVEHVMGTAVTLDLRDRDLPLDQLGRAVVAAVATLHEADRTFSLWQPDSVLSRLRRGGCPPQGPQHDDLVEVERACRQAMLLTTGWFNPWEMPGGYDPTGLVKGWAAQRAMVALTAGGVRHAMVNAGGDLLVRGDATGTPGGRGWRVGVTDPADPAQLLDGLTVWDAAVATSGAYERGSLAVDPFTQEPVHRLAGASVRTADLALADACATAATAHGPAALEWLERVPGLEALLVDLDGTLLTTTGWPGAARLG